MATPPDLLELVRRNVCDSGKSDLAHLFKRAELTPCVQGTLGLKLRVLVHSGDLKPHMNSLVSASWVHMKLTNSVRRDDNVSQLCSMPAGVDSAVTFISTQII